MYKKLILVMIVVMLVTIGLVITRYLPAAEALPRNVIFIHADGAGPVHYTMARLLHYGPDGTLNWDRLPYLAAYKSHVHNNLQACSVSGAVAHASGVKTNIGYFGLCPDGEPLQTILEEARETGFATGLINSGTITEPGTGVFVANVKCRRDHADIARQILDSEVDVILGGGERWFLPKGTQGRHGEGSREDGLNLIEQARAAGYTVVFTREELLEIDPHDTSKLLGLFAAHHTFNSKSEEVLYERNLPLYGEGSPTVAEMTAIAIQILPARSEKGFILIVEEEGTDNFSNANNAEGMIEATKRADDAIGVAKCFARENGATLVLTAADTIAGGPAMLAWPTILLGQSLAARDRNGAPIDGVGFLEGKEKEVPFLTPCGRAFAIRWATYGDEGAGVIVRAYGTRAELVTGTIDNTDIYHIMRSALGLPTVI